MTSCDNCSQIIETEYVELIIPTIFGECGYCGNLCVACKSGLEYCAVCYLEVFDKLNVVLKNRAMQLKNKTRFLMK